MIRGGYIMYNSRIMNFHVNSSIRPLPVDPNYFVLKKRNKFTRWLMRMLKKLNVLDNRVEYEELTNVKKVEVDLFKLKDFLLQEMDFFASRNIPIERILLGRSQYEELIRGSELNSPLDIPYNEMTRYFMGVRVQLNPFIDGVVFVPREQWY